MKKLITALLLITVSFAFADSNITVYNEDVSSGTCEPLISQGFEDVVSWNALSNAPATFFRATSCVIGNYFYTWGSQNAPTSQAFNLTTGQWSAGTPPTFGYCNVDGVVANGSFYQVCTYSGSYGNQVQKFTPTGGGPTGTWEQMAVYPHSACGVAVGYDGGNNIYAGGGGGSTGNLSTAYVYSISANTWTPIASIPMALKYAGGAFCGGEFHIVGGITAPYNQHYAYNPASNTWSTKATPLAPPSFGLFSTVNDDDCETMYIVGGGGGYGTWPAIDATQIYDPGSDTWMLDTPWPVGNAGLNAVAYAGEGVIYTGGGYPAVSTAHMGEGFPFGVPTPMDVDVALSLTSGSPVPAGGGMLAFNIELTNNETFSGPVDIWTLVTIPGGTVVGPLINIQNYNIAASAVVDRDRDQYVPAGAPAGAYTYNAYVGNYPNTIWDEAEFAFSKTADDGGSFSLEEWVCSGEPFEEVQTAVIPVQHNMLSAYPNPFNPETTISFTLENADNVMLAVYDIQGREVARLANGWVSAGSHDRTFNAVDLSSGVYFVSLTTASSVQTLKMLLVK